MTKLMRSVYTVGFVAFALATAACHEQNANGGDAQVRSATSSQDAGASQGTDATGALTMINPSGVTQEQVNSLFKDQWDDAATAANINCLGNMGSLKTSTHPWPAAYKALAAPAVLRLPKVREMIAAGFLGFYFTDDAQLQGVGGLTCSDPYLKHAIVFINANELSTYKTNFVQDWQGFVEHPVQMNKQYINYEPNYIVLAIAHEFFHVIDNLTYRSPRYGGMTLYQIYSAPRQQVMLESWNTDDSAKYQTGVDIAVATGSSIAAATPVLSACAYQFSPIASGSQLSFLSDVTTTQVAAIAKSNFLDDYSTVNPAEDWAQSNAIYFMATRYNEYSRLTAYSEDVAPQNTGAATVVLNYDVLTQLKTSAIVRHKVCMIAQLMYGEDCQKTIAAVHAFP